MTKEIRISAALILDRDGRTLLVRKAGTRAFQQPGGKIDPGESPESALCRELGEEIGLQIGADALRHLGRFRAPAANEPGCQVVAELFLLRLSGEADIAAGAEIAEAVWIDPAAAGLPLAPLTGKEILPRLVAGLFRAPA